MTDTRWKARPALIHVPELQHSAPPKLVSTLAMRYPFVIRSSSLPDSSLSIGTASSAPPNARHQGSWVDREKKISHQSFAFQSQKMLPALLSVVPLRRVYEYFSRNLLLFSFQSLRSFSLLLMCYPVKEFPRCSTFLSFSFSSSPSMPQRQ